MTKLEPPIIRLFVVWLMALAMLFLVVFWNHSYTFYTLLRWVCCPAFAYSAVEYLKWNRLPWVWVFGVQAALFNPVFIVHLNRNLWQVVDWFCIGSIIIAAVVLLRKK